MNDDRRRLDDVVAATGDAALIVQRGRAAFDADPLVVRAAKNIVTEIGEATKALSSDATDAIADVPWRAMRATPWMSTLQPVRRTSSIESTWNATARGRSPSGFVPGWVLNRTVSHVSSSAGAGCGGRCM